MYSKIIVSDRTAKERKNTMNYRNKKTGQVGVLTADAITKTLTFDDGTEVILSPARFKKDWEMVIEDPHKKLTFYEFSQYMMRWNDSHDMNEASLSGVICYKQKNFEDPYTEEERSYRVWNNCKMFQTGGLDTEMIGDSLDGSDLGTDLGYYDWSVEYCYLEG